MNCLICGSKLVPIIGDQIGYFLCQTNYYTVSSSYQHIHQGYAKADDNGDYIESILIMDGVQKPKCVHRPHDSNQQTLKRINTLTCCRINVQMNYTQLLGDYLGSKNCYIEYFFIGKNMNYQYFTLSDWSRVYIRLQFNRFVVQD